MRFVSFLAHVTRGGRSEQLAFASRHRLPTDRGLTLTAEFWAEDAAEHRLDVVDEPDEGSPQVVATRTVRSPTGPGLLTVELPLPPLGLPGGHRLHLDVDGERAMDQPIAVTVRELPRRGQRSRYKGRGTLAALERPPIETGANDGWAGWPQASFASTEGSVQDEIGGGYLYHGELFPMSRVSGQDGKMSGLWIAAYFRGFSRTYEGPHVFTVTDFQPQGPHRLVAVNYEYVEGPRLLVRLNLDPLGPLGVHTLGLSIDGRAVGELSVTL